jgi:proteasome assembly chaperone (PAC2) family protein
MSKKNSTPKGNYGRIIKEDLNPDAKAKKDFIYQYNIGPDYQIELKANMLYYKKKDSFGHYDLVKAEMTENNSYGSHELRTHAIEMATKMGLELRDSISGSLIPLK